MLLLFAFPGCSQPGVSSNSKSTAILDLSRLKQLPLESKASEIEQALGKPTEIETYRDYPDEVAWLYFEGNYLIPRITLTVSKQGLLLAKTWDVRENDPLEDFEHLKKEFPAAKLRKLEREWENPHAAPIGTIFADEKKGLYVWTHDFSGKVESISWDLPKRRALAKERKKADLVPYRI